MPRGEAFARGRSADRSSSLPKFAGNDGFRVIRRSVRPRTDRIITGKLWKPLRRGDLTVNARRTERSFRTRASSRSSFPAFLPIYRDRSAGRLSRFHRRSARSLRSAIRHCLAGTRVPGDARPYVMGRADEGQRVRAAQMTAIYQPPISSVDFEGGFSSS